MFQMCGVFAEFERGMIRERANAGLARAKARGTRLGRRPVANSVTSPFRRKYRRTRIRQLRWLQMAVIPMSSNSQRRAAG
jgi:DNA invertase Pin-like site-specific DNA recombinase